MHASHEARADLEGGMSVIAWLAMQDLWEDRTVLGVFSSADKASAHIEGITKELPDGWQNQFSKWGSFYVAGYAINEPEKEPVLQSEPRESPASKLSTP